MIARTDFAHRGRFQAQGGRGKGIEISEPWAQERSLSARAGFRLLDALHSRLGAADQKLRESAFEQARAFIGRALEAKGVAAFMKKSFPQKPNKNDERVDVEVHKGLAFFPAEDPA